jgi:exodeoxyribonuclease VII large subunit
MDRMNRAAALTVSQVTQQVKALLENDLILQDLWVKGELSNAKIHSSGHFYFTLKDARSQLKGVMWASNVRRMRFRPEDGIAVLIRGQVAVYEPGGVYQIYATEIEPAGVGALHLEFEALKKRLAAEGLFDEALKRPLPAFPRRIGLVTAPGGAALRDMITVAQRRHPGVRLLLAPALVQGAEAPASLIGALHALSRAPEVDVIIIGRGGGSMEDLWAFNDEALARAIRACPVPVVSAVGHETDWTIADFVADRRAATPSAAAEIVVPARAELLGQVQSLATRLSVAVRRQVERKRERLERATNRPVLLRPEGRLQQERQRLDQLQERLEAAFRKGLERRQLRLGSLAGRLDALSPLAVLGRGYAIAFDAAGRPVRQAARMQPGDHLRVRVAEGALACRVEAVEEV